MSRIWDCTELTGGELLVMLAISDFANDKGFAWPSVETLARKARLSERQVQFLIRKLEAAHFLQIQPNAGQNGSNMYRVVTGVQFPHPEGVKFPHPGVKPTSPGGCSLAHQGGEAHFTQSVIEPSKEPSVPPLPPKGGSGDWKPDDVQLRLNRLFKRKPSTRWNRRELKAYKELEISEDDLILVEAYYGSSIPTAKDFRRHELQTLLNNWNGEVDRARNFRPNSKEEPTLANKELDRVLRGDGF